MRRLAALAGLGGGSRCVEARKPMSAGDDCGPIASADCAEPAAAAAHGALQPSFRPPAAPATTFARLAKPPSAQN